VSIEQRSRRIGITLDSKQGVIWQFKSQLSFPDYCTDNWDSFEECLLDFIVSSDELISIMHLTESSLSVEDYDIYSSILSEAVKTGRFEVLE
jgi:hypothetical protein